MKLNHHCYLNFCILMFTVLASDAFADASDAMQKDRDAILAMQGEYKVDFHFDETVALSPGYKRHAPQRTGGFETVIVLESTPTKIMLQHILVSDKGHVTKHWRQDWQYEAADRFEFVADQTWQRIALMPQQTSGAWTQCVYEVSDAPRYCGTGKWNHRYGNATWTSDRTWRPLPRREYTKRSDYNAMNVENRHTVTPNGWTHEQDNTKVKRSSDGTQTSLVREFGFNEYQKVSDYDFAPAYHYWTKTKHYWAQVRMQWDKRMPLGSRLSLKTKVDGMPIIMATFEAAEGYDAAKKSPQLVNDELEKLLNQQTQTIATSKSLVK
jgi:hypothetical protein